jgi:hypothetical protein
MRVEQFHDERRPMHERQPGVTAERVVQVADIDPNEHDWMVWQ